jgi:glycosyltransferase involved in cell wall biosynthesis
MTNKTIKPACSIIIRCCNEEEHIGRLISGILAQNINDTEIIVVDSGSSDATLSIASRYPVKIVQIKQEDFSFGYSLNIGCATATSNCLVLASAHVYPVYNDWLEKLLTPFSDRNIAIVYGKQRGNETTKYSEHRIFDRWFPEKSNLNQDYPFYNNANAAIRKELWEKLPYNEELTGIEDIDWSKRVLGLGYRIAYNADAEVIHVHNETPQRIFNRYRREAMAMKSIFPYEHFSLYDFFKLYISNIVSDGFYACHDRVFFRSLLSILVFRLMQFWGTYRGFSQHDDITSRMKNTFYYPNILKPPRKVHAPSAPDRKIDYSKYYFRNDL